MSGQPKPSQSRGRLRVGTSGWAYPHWKDRFYPEGLRVKDRFSYYAAQFDTVEINGSFYRLPSEAAVRAWSEQAPPGFVFAWKASRFITQAKKLKDVADPVERVFGRMAALGEALGPALFQLPPQLRLNLDRLDQFLPLLPTTTRTAIEFRHPSWYTPQVLRRLADHDVALCISDHHDAPAPWEATASFIYVRGHGPGGRYIGRYPSADLGDWAKLLERWLADGRDVYAYFDNDIEGAAPLDARDLKARRAPSLSGRSSQSSKEAEPPWPSTVRASFGQSPAAGVAATFGAGLAAAGDRAARPAIAR